MVISTRCKVSTYGGIWLLTDGHCKFSGLGFNPKTNTWDYVSNFYPSKFETATSLGLKILKIFEIFEKKKKQIFIIIY